MNGGLGTLNVECSETLPLPRSAAQGEPNPLFLFWRSGVLAVQIQGALSVHAHLALSERRRP